MMALDQQLTGSCNMTQIAAGEANAAPASNKARQVVPVNAPACPVLQVAQ
jgi:hypothetical protein